MPQFNAFCEAAEKAKRYDQAGAIAAVAVGTNGKDIKKSVNELIDGSG